MCEDHSNHQPSFQLQTLKRNMWKKGIVILTLVLVSTQEPLNCPGVKYVSKEEWYARPVASVTETQTIPIPNVFIRKTNTTCTDTKTCSNVMRVIQATFMDSNNYHDIAYHFAIGADNSIYEGRGWFLRGALEEDFNMKSLSFAYIGSEKPSDEMVQLKDKLIDCGKKRNYIKKDAVIKEHDSVDGFPDLQLDPSTDNDLTETFPTSGQTLPSGLPTYPTYPNFPAYQLVMTPSGYYQVIPITTMQPQGTWPQQQWPGQGQYPIQGQQIFWSPTPASQTWPQQWQQGRPQQGQYPNGQQWQNPYQVIPSQIPTQVNSPGTGTIVVVPYPFPG